MKKGFYQPTDNYERNILMTKHYCGSLAILILPVLLFITLASTCYLMLVSKEPLLMTIFKVANLKLGWNFEFDSLAYVYFIFQLLLVTYLLIALLQIFFTGRDSDISVTPNLGITLLYRLSQIELLLSYLAFIGIVIVTFIFLFGKMDNFEYFGKLLNMTVEDLKAYKISFVITMVVIDVIAFLGISYSQSQTSFLKCLKLCLYESLPKNKGAHKYGIYSMVIGVIMLCFSAFTTFMYYCYRDVFIGLGISLEKTYVMISFAYMYSMTLFPFVIGINAFKYSSMVDEINTYGTLYNDFAMVGPAN